MVPDYCDYLRVVAHAWQRPPVGGAVRGRAGHLWISQSMPAVSKRSTLDLSPKRVTPTKGALEFWRFRNCNLVRSRSGWRTQLLNSEFSTLSAFNPGNRKINGSPSQGVSS